MNNKDLLEKLAKDYIYFPMGTTIYISSGAKVYKYDGMFADFNMLAHHMQRVFTPLVELTSEEQIMRFLDNSKEDIWEDDFAGGLLAKGATFDDEHKMNEMTRLAGMNTRAVAFFYDKKEYSTEIKYLRESARMLANRYSMRVGIVTDEKLVSKMKKAHAEFFDETSMTSMVLRRYDGSLHKLNLYDVQPVQYAWWLTI